MLLRRWHFPISTPETPPIRHPSFNYCALGTAFQHFRLPLPLANDFLLLTIPDFGSGVW